MTRDDRSYYACSTPPGIGGIAVIRVGGVDSFALVDKIFTVTRSADKAGRVSDMRGYTAAFGQIKDPQTNNWIDDAVCTVFRAPHSYTGENIVEISCHGGHTVRQEIFRVLSENGARTAEAGEFTKRAFLAGKLDLSQAEAVMDVISAKSELALSAAGRQLAGGVKQAIQRLSDQIYTQFCALETLVEFPEYDPMEFDGKRLLKAKDELSSLYKSFSRGRILKDGMTVVLAGMPNSGKSSLLNLLAGFERAIVTEEAGTTRDTLEIFISMAGIPLRVVDTAGLRDTGDKVESIGIRRAVDAADQSDILLWLADENEEDLHSDSSFIKLLRAHAGYRPVGIIITKSDILDSSRKTGLRENIRRFVEQEGFGDDVFYIHSFSSKTGEGLDVLEEKVSEIYEMRGQVQDEEVMLTNARHANAVLEARDFLQEALSLLQAGHPPDIACALLRSAMESLGEITGAAVSDELIRQIFSRFCVGK